jgi:hypothetical protein
MKVASTARRIFDPQGKKTFATISAQSGHSEISAICPLSGVKQTGLPDDALSAFDPKRT